MIPSRHQALYFLMLLAGTLLHSGSGAVAQNSMQQQPNIVLINIDDLGYADTELYGNRDFSTPHILKLASMGMTFTNGYAAASNCAPSRASMLSGQYTPRHGIYTVGTAERGKSRDRKIIPVPNHTVLADSIVTMAEAFQAAGYTTISIGKWHLGESPTTQGFSVNIGGTHRGAPASYFSPYQNPALPDGPEGEYLTDRLTDEAIAQLKKATRPFFLYLPFFAVHTPLQAKEMLVEKYRNKGFDEKTAVLGAMVEHLDSNIGRLTHALSAMNVLDKTIIILTSDNGGIAAIHSQHPLRAGKGSYYEGGTRVPMVFVWKDRIPAGVTSNSLISNIDFFPTLLSLAGLQKTSGQLIDGIDMSGVLTGYPSAANRSLFWYFPVYLQAYDGSKDEARDSLFRTRPGLTMRSGHWKLHKYYETQTYELYDLSKDPAERHNLVDTESAELVNRLKAELAAWEKHHNVVADFKKNPGYQAR